MGIAVPTALLEHLQPVLSSQEFPGSWNMPPFPWARRTRGYGILVAKLPCSTTINLASLSSQGASVPPGGALLSLPCQGCYCLVCWRASTSCFYAFCGPQVARSHLLLRLMFPFPQWYPCLVALRGMCANWCY